MELAYSIPDVFANVGTVIPALSDKIPTSTQLCCLGGAIDSPDNFYVNPYQTWNELEHFMQTFQVTYRNMISGHHEVKAILSLPDEKSLKPGLLVAAWYQKEWHRAQILKHLDNNGFLIRLLDYGDTRIVEINDLRYLLLSLTEFPIQAVRCQLIVKNRKVQKQAGQKVNWTTDQRENFLQIIYDRGLAVNFKEFGIIEGGERLWKIELQILEKEFGKNGGKRFLSHKEIERALFN